jgi:hypothetical protein
MSAPPPTPRLAFREMTPDDLDDMAALLGDPQVMHYYPHPKSRDEALAWIAWNQRLYREHGFGLWLLTLRDGGEFAGDCGLTPQQVDGTPRSRSATTFARRSRVVAWPPKPRQPAATTPATCWESTG